MKKNVVISRLLFRDDITDGEFRTLAIMVKMMDSGGSVTANHKQLAIQRGKSDSTISDHISGLILKCYLIKYTRNGYANTYMITDKVK